MKVTTSFLLMFHFMVVTSTTTLGPSINTSPNVLSDSSKSTTNNVNTTAGNMTTTTILTPPNSNDTKAATNVIAGTKNKSTTAQDTSTTASVTHKTSAAVSSTQTAVTTNTTTPAPNTTLVLPALTTNKTSPAATTTNTPAAVSSTAFTTNRTTPAPGTATKSAQTSIQRTPVPTSTKTASASNSTALAPITIQTASSAINITRTISTTKTVLTTPKLIPAPNTSKSSSITKEPTPAPKNKTSAATINQTSASSTNKTSTITLKPTPAPNTSKTAPVSDSPTSAPNTGPSVNTNETTSSASGNVSIQNSSTQVPVSTVKPSTAPVRTTPAPPKYQSLNLNTDTATTGVLRVNLHLSEDSKNCTEEDWNTELNGIQGNLGVIKSETFSCTSESDVEVKIILFAGQLASIQPEHLLQPIQNLSGIHINNSDAATATITQFLHQNQDLCLAINICPKAYRCDSTRRKCIHLCEDKNCGNHGDCHVTIDTSGQVSTECRCKIDDDYVYSGDLCENSESSKSRQRKIILGITLPIIIILFIIVVFMCVKMNRGESPDSKQKYDMSTF